MSSELPSRTEPEHDPTEATRWFNQWHVYRSIVDHDWMGHRGIFDAIKHHVLLRHPGPFTLLDLGCGDGGFIKAAFTDTGLWAYTGVDASQAALCKAREELAGARFQVRLIEADMLDYLSADTSAADRPFDVILASYAVHHLPVREKQEFFRRAHGTLAHGGSLLFADIFRRGDETREQYLAAYAGMMRNDWRELTPESLVSTTEHVVQRDFPETIATIRELAREAGFRNEPRELFCDATGFHRLFSFTT